jgi:membrane-bound ClpP family serine protease
MRKDYVQVREKANLLTGVGILLTVVPLGMCIISFVTAADSSPFDALLGLGWAFFVTIALLPIGLALFFGGLGWMVVLKRNRERLDLDEEDEDNA